MFIEVKMRDENGNFRPTAVNVDRIICIRANYKNADLCDIYFEHSIGRVKATYAEMCAALEKIAERW